MKNELIKCEHCGAMMPSYMERCSDCGIKLRKVTIEGPTENDSKTRVFNGGYVSEEEFKILSSDNGRHWFITVWLWFGIVVIGLVALAWTFLLLRKENIQLWENIYMYINIVVNLLINILLLNRMKIGFWILIGLVSIGIISVIVYYYIIPITNLGYSIFEILALIVGTFINYRILCLKKNGIRYWDTMS